MAKPKVTIYTDGACTNNGRRNSVGGWGFVALYYPIGKPHHQREKSGAKKNTTNNQMELTAVIEGLKVLKKPCEVTIKSDSRYIVDAFNKRWIPSWKRSGWITSTGTPVKNKQLWIELLNLIKKGKHDVHFEWVKGHSGNTMNERADTLAVEAKNKLL